MSCRERISSLRVHDVQGGGATLLRCDVVVPTRSWGGDVLTSLWKREPRHSEFRSHGPLLPAVLEHISSNSSGNQDSEDVDSFAADENGDLVAQAEELSADAKARLDTSPMEDGDHAEGAERSSAVPSLALLETTSPAGARTDPAVARASAGTTSSSGVDYFEEQQSLSSTNPFQNRNTNHDPFRYGHDDGNQSSSSSIELGGDMSYHPGRDHPSAGASGRMTDFHNSHPAVFVL